jgi:hypothetical protein
MTRALALAAVGLVLPVLPVAADDGGKSPELDKKACALVKQAADCVRQAKSLHVEGEIATKSEDGDGQRSIRSEVVYDLEKLNLFSLRTRLDGNAGAGPDIVCDGKRLLIHAKRLKQYTEDEAPEELSAFGRVIPRFGHPLTGMLFQNLLTDDPYETLMDGVTRCAYAGKDKLNGTEAHHLTFEQPNLNWELWIAAEGKPVVLKALSTRTGEGGKMTTVETYRNWKLDAPAGRDTFAIHAPEGSKKVKVFKQPGQGSDKGDK